MQQPAIQGSLSMCCVTGSGFVIHSLEHDQVGLTSFAAGVAHHTMDWLLDRGIKNSGLCVRAAGHLSNDGNGQDEIAVEAELRGVPLDETACQQLAHYVRQRARLPIAEPISIRWTWRI